MASNTDSGTNFNLRYSHRPNPPVLTSQRSSWWETLQWGKHVWSAGEKKNIQIIWAIYLSFCPKMTRLEPVSLEWVNLCSLLPWGSGRACLTRTTKPQSVWISKWSVSRCSAFPSVYSCESDAAVQISKPPPTESLAGFFCPSCIFWTMNMKKIIWRSHV